MPLDDAGVGRRRVLGILAGLAAGAVTACSGPDAPPAATSPSTSATTAAPPSPAPTSATPPRIEWRRLSATMRGDVVRPGDPAYPGARELFNPRFDHIRPRAVAFCESPQDVAAAVRFARDAGLPIALRSGGHSYGGWSTGTGLVVDVSRIAHVLVTGATAQVGAGASVIDSYAGVARHGLALAGGSCPSVGITGLTLGGGQGVLSRAWGLTCDSLLGLDLVLADGRLVSADADHDPDLYWASRGGGGGSFGVVTGLRFQLRSAPRVTLFYRRWSWSVAPTVLAGWQQWVGAAPRELWSTCKLLTDPGGETATVTVSGSWLGEPAGLDRQLRALVAAIGQPPVAGTAGTRGYLDAMLAEAGCRTVPAARCSTPRSAFAAASSVLSDPLTEKAVRTCVEHVAERHSQGHPGQAGVSFDVLGGAVGDLATDATAFPYRRALAIAQYTAGWPTTASATEVTSAARWPTQLREALTGTIGDTAYVNYQDPTLRGWQQAYYADNYGRLQAVKQRYDPNDVFSFPQSVLPSS